MKHGLWVVSLVMLIGLVAVGGCVKKSVANAKPTQRVAGTQQHFTMPAGAKTVTVTLSSTGIHVMPATVPQGAVAIKIVNETKNAQTVTLATSGVSPMTRSVKPASSISIAMLSAKPGAVSITVPSATKGVKPMKTSFTVSKGTAKTTTTGMQTPAGK
jgi:hypothetical protein